MRHVQLSERVHVHPGLRHVFHLKGVLIELDVGAVGRLRARVGRALGKICGICDLIRSLARRRLAGRRRGLHHRRIVLNEGL